MRVLNSYINRYIYQFEKTQFPINKMRDREVQNSKTPPVIVYMDMCYPKPVETPQEFQERIKSSFGMIEFYGGNWDVFWDSITGIIEVPEKIVIEGWLTYKEKQPEDAKIFETLMEQYNSTGEYGNCECIYLY